MDDEKKIEGSLSSSRSLNLISRRWRISGAIWQADTMSVCCKISALLWKCVCESLWWCNHKLPKQHIRCFSPLFFPSVRYMMASPAVSTANVHVGMRLCARPPTSPAYTSLAEPPPHPQEKIKNKNPFFLTQRHIRRQHTSLQTCCNEWCRHHLPNVNFFHVFLFP